MSSVKAWCMAMCCVCDGWWRQWRVVSELGAWPCVVSVMVGGGGGGVVSELGAWPCVVSLMVGGGGG